VRVFMAGRLLPFSPVYRTFVSVDRPQAKGRGERNVVDWLAAAYVPCPKEGRHV